MRPQQKGRGVVERADLVDSDTVSRQTPAPPCQPPEVIMELRYLPGRR
jgi:hypothetical protein